jgi:5-methylcytosine-specific restriction endonuclease McrA
MTEYKACSRCKQVANVSQFNKDKSSATGYQDRCRACEKVVRRNYYLTHKETEIKRVSNWHKSTEQGKQRRKRARLNRQALVRNAESKFITRKDFLGLASSPCFYCGSTNNLTLDHVIPLSRGGRHSIGNLVSACNLCNATKNTRLIVEWKKETRHIPTQM